MSEPATATPRQEAATGTAGRHTRRLGGLALGGLATITAIISYRHGLEVVHVTGTRDWVAYLVPLVPDLMIFASSLALLEAAQQGAARPRLAVVALAFGIVATVAMNVASGWHHGYGGALVSALAPVALVLSYETLMGMVRRGRQNAATTAALTSGTSAARYVICAGSSGTLTLRRPLPRRDLELAAPAGTRVHLPDTLSGPHPPIVYLIRNGARVKIGTTGNLRRRISQLCLRPEDVVLVLSGDAEYEGELHERFADLRVGNSEWFKWSGELTGFVSAGGDQDDSSDEDDEIADDDSEAGVEGDDEAAAARRQPERRSTGRTRKRVVRHSLSTWVDLTESIWRQESDRLGRQPTGEEFAAAIRKARRGPVSVTTAKKIRTEILRCAQEIDEAARDNTEPEPEPEPEPVVQHTDNGHIPAAAAT